MIIVTITKLVTLINFFPTIYLIPIKSLGKEPEKTLTIREPEFCGYPLIFSWCPAVFRFPSRLQSDFWESSNLDTGIICNVKKIRNEDVKRYWRIKRKMYTNKYRTEKQMGMSQ